MAERKIHFAAAYFSRFRGKNHNIEMSLNPPYGRSPWYTQRNALFLEIADAIPIWTSWKGYGPDKIPLEHLRFPVIIDVSGRHAEILGVYPPYEVSAREIGRPPGYFVLGMELEPYTGHLVGRERLSSATPSTVHSLEILLRDTPWNLEISEGKIGLMYG